MSPLKKVSSVYFLRLQYPSLSPSRSLCKLYSQLLSFVTNMPTTS